MFGCRIYWNNVPESTLCAKYTLRSTILNTALILCQVITVSGFESFIVSHLGWMLNVELSFLISVGFLERRISKGSGPWFQNRPDRHPLCFCSALLQTLFMACLLLWPFSWFCLNLLPTTAWTHVLWNRLGRWPSLEKGSLKKQRKTVVDILKWTRAETTGGPWGILGGPLVDWLIEKIFYMLNSNTLYKYIIFIII